MTILRWQTAYVSVFQTMVGQTNKVRERFGRVVLSSASAWEEGGGTSEVGRRRDDEAAKGEEKIWNALSTNRGGADRKKK